MSLIAPLFGGLAFQKHCVVADGSAKIMRLTDLRVTVTHSRHLGISLHFWYSTLPGGGKLFSVRASAQKRSVVRNMVQA